MGVLKILLICLIVSLTISLTGCVIGYQKIEEIKTSREIVEVNETRVIVESEDDLDLRSDVKVVDGNVMINIEGKVYE